jgi:predicted dehydrogenase
MQARVRGERGELYVLNPFAPQFFHRLKLRTPAGARVERLRSEPTYTHQLRAFVRAVRGEAPAATDGRHGVANMRAIDAIYRAAGLAPRGTHPEVT